MKTMNAAKILRLGLEQDWPDVVERGRALCSTSNDYGLRSISQYIFRLIAEIGHEKVFLNTSMHAIATERDIQYLLYQSAVRGEHKLFKAVHHTVPSFSFKFAIHGHSFVYWARSGKSTEITSIVESKTITQIRAPQKSTR